MTGSVQNECGRHARYPADGPIRIDRCTHIGNRFVVVTIGDYEHETTAFVDYVEDINDGLDVIIEQVAYMRSDKDVYGQSNPLWPSLVTSVYETAVQRMRDSDPPHPDVTWRSPV